MMKINQELGQGRMDEVRFMTRWRGGDRGEKDERHRSNGELMVEQWQSETSDTHIEERMRR